MTGRTRSATQAGSSALREQIRDERVRSLPLTGAVDQFIDSTDALGDRDLRHAATATQLAGPAKQIRLASA